MSQELKQYMVHGGLWATGGRLVAIVASFVLNLVLARSLAPGDYGTFFVIQSTMLILATLGIAGMDLVAVRFVAARKAFDDWGSVRRVIRTCLVTALATTAVVCAIFYPLVPWLFGTVLRMPAAIAVGGLLVAWLLASTLQRQLAESFRGLGDMRCATLFGGFRNNGILLSLLTCGMAIGLWTTGHMTLRAAVAMIVIASSIVLLVAAFTLHRRLAAGSHVAQSTALPPWSMATALREGWPLWLGGMIAVIRPESSGWFAAAFDVAGEVALYGIAQRFIILLTAPLTIINILLPPIIATLHARGEMARLERVVQSVGGLASLPCIAVFIFIVTAGRPVLGFLFGAHYEAAYPLLVILAVAQIANVVTGSWGPVLSMTGHRVQMLWISSLAGATQVGCTIVGGYHAGVLGVAAGACIGTVVGNILGMLAVRRHLGIWTFISVRRKVLVEALTLLAGRVLRRAAPPPPPRAG